MNESSEISEGFKMTELGLLPEEWEVVPLADVLEEFDVRVKEFDSGDASKFPVLSLTKNQGLILQSERFGKRIAIDDEGAESWEAFSSYVESASWVRK